MLFISDPIRPATLVTKGSASGENIYFTMENMLSALLCPPSFGLLGAPYPDAVRMMRLSL